MRPRADQAAYVLRMHALQRLVNESDRNAALFRLFQHEIRSYGWPMGRYEVLQILSLCVICWDIYFSLHAF